MYVAALNSDNGSKVEGLVVITTRDGLQRLIEDMGPKHPGRRLYLDALDDWTGDVAAALYVIVTDTRRGYSVAFADCVNCAISAITLAFGGMVKCRLASVAYAIGVPAGDDCTALDKFLRENGELLGSTVGGSA